ncbi:flagellar hook-associated protein FlgK [Cellulomonas soli]|uniref:Flagellar hook-associated protein 1 n=1 Tax=Cellulomonas soli TaxID=931535 RepID=A0A512PEP5_9CELL|nr:flagellar hook-associated protein FlgK [Cellulomonas soli]NYI59524.1 flagellar hook-associated protein 1 FlgK [Cellulomonas soli]GEP69684.1 flagellar hook-associated protein FlgK [Cellulomonas soli]
MSTFSGLGTALSSLIAQRQALEVSGQNVANANTVGYTRQRATMVSQPTAVVASMFSTSSGVGNGTRVTGVARLGDTFLDAQVRVTTSSSGYLSARASAYDTLENSVGEPAKTGLATQLSTMWSSWQDLANTPDKDSARSVVLESSTAVVDRLASLYTSAQTQWEQGRTSTVETVAQANTVAANVADLNKEILNIQNAGGNANELMDQRDLLVTQLSEMVGGVASTRDNGQIDVLLGGNSLVSGTTVHTLQVSGATTFLQANAGTSVSVVWADRPTVPVGLSGGTVAGQLSVLAPPDATGTGGILTEAAARYDTLATTIANQVNALHTTGQTIAGAAGTAFFTFAAGQPAALGLTLAVTDKADIAVATPTGGALDGSIGKAIGALGSSTSGPDAVWSASVVELGSRAASATARYTVAEAARTNASTQQLSQASVDTDEETVNMLAYQRAYEGAARVMTAIDEMLDTLINRTGVVGR